MDTTTPAPTFARWNRLEDALRAEGIDAVPTIGVTDDTVIARLAVYAAEGSVHVRDHITGGVWWGFVVTTRRDGAPESEADPTLRAATVANVAAALEALGGVR